MLQHILSIAALALLTSKAIAFDPIEHIHTKLAEGNKKVVVPKGTYTLTPKDVIYLRLDNVEDVEIDLSGVEFIGKIRTKMIHLNQCKRVTIKGLTIDYETLPFTQAVITNIDADKNWDVKVIEGYPMEDIPSTGDCWPIQVYHKDTLELHNPMRFRDNINIARTGKDTYRITGGIDRRGNLGDIAVWSVKDTKNKTSAGAISAIDCEAIRFEDITIYSTPHQAAFYEKCGNKNTYLRCKVIRRPPEIDLQKRGLKRLRSGNHDAFMHRGSIVGPQLIGCVAQYHSDDCVNISGMYSIITEAKGRELRILVNWLGLNFSPGDTAQVMTYEGECPDDVTVTAIEPDGDVTSEDRKYLDSLGFWPGLAGSCKKAYKLTIDRDVDFSKGSVIISNNHQGNGFLIKDCVFGRSRARGLLIKASNGVIENNFIEGCNSSGMQISMEYQWMEGGCSRDLLISNNRLRNNGGAAITIAGTSGNKSNLPPNSHRNIALINNVIYESEQGIVVSGCKGLTITGNKLTIFKSDPWRGIFLRNTEDVTQSDNVVKLGQE